MKARVRGRLVRARVGWITSQFAAYFARFVLSHDEGIRRQNHGEEGTGEGECGGWRR